MRNVLHFIIVTILIGLVTVGVYVGLTSMGLMPVEASAQSVPIDGLSSGARKGRRAMGSISKAIPGSKSPGRSSL